LPSRLPLAFRWTSTNKQVVGIVGGLSMDPLWS
jgi:hypothetical protein